MPFSFQDDRQYFESKKENIIPKKDSRSNLNLYVKARLNTEGTMDSTPPMINSYDIELL